MKLFGKNVVFVGNEKEKNKQDKSPENTKQENLKLTVFEALQDDVYKGIARIDPNLMEKFGIKRGDAISITNKKKSATAIADKCYPSDIGEKIIRIDGVLRKNAGVLIRDKVIIKKVEVKEAKEVVIAPTQKGIIVEGDSEGLQKGFLGRVVSQGDLTILGAVKKRIDEDVEELNDDFGNLGDILGGMGLGTYQINFVVLSTNPNCPVIVTENTNIILKPKYIEINPIKKISDIGKKIPENNIILLKELPSDIKNYYKVRDINEIIKIYEIEEDILVNKYEDNQKKILIIGNYYYSELKKQRKLKE